VRVIFGDFEKSNWAWDAVANAYYWHRFFSHQPDLNLDSPAVREALLDVVDFWLGLGVDGIRLDAAPFLFEREGTTCENLPETHGFLKELRAHVDTKFADRMLLAEANQWPADAASYFGSGDECHMAFHFPLASKIFLGVELEDRHPITEVFETTPPIPASCQWALFLRNHDELSLEMATEEERDLMYEAYAKDKRCRINAGIRRRLAPLLGGDRAAIELLNVLLFTLPGTPIIYYGDEIGMGDNCRLPDRSGVRTPMQWSSGRNAGFSSAEPSRLYLPLIADPPYHYRKINVASQNGAESSLLEWTRRLIHITSRHAALRSGEVRFLMQGSSQVLSYVRSAGSEHVLVVANLSLRSQVLELGLPEYEGMAATELSRDVKFLSGGKNPLQLALGPRGYCMLSLLPRRRTISQLVTSPAQAYGNLPLGHQEAWVKGQRRPLLSGSQSDKKDGGNRQ
jgi:maltose alpha-D-glucosyltransferase/alpha-amylase